MEGDGMVAIVQGLKDAGLAVTVTNRAHLLPISLQPLLPCRSSVQTSTDHVYNRSTAVEVCDGRYFSSYQLAHCNIRPTSPPQRISEFPPQRPELIPNYGNFEVGGRVSSECGPIPAPHRRQLRISSSWIDRARGSPPRDPFVESLRRYPDPSLDGTGSTELLQRLISYTQNKHLSKHSNSRSLRSLREEPPTNEKTDRQTKNIQTYTRTNAASRDTGANTSNDLRFNFAKKDRSCSSTSSPYNLTKRSDTSPASYDYLKASPRQARRTEVRYLNDVKRCVRDTLKQILNDDPLMCPRIRRRFSQHRREHHKICEDSCPDEGCPGKASVATSFEGPLRRSISPIATRNCPGVCCQCENPFPCNCEPSTSKDDSLELYNEPMDSNVTDDNDSKIADEIFEWLKDLPVFANDTEENKAKRETMIKNLAQSLINLKGNANYEENAKEDIKKCLNNLPIWYPGSKREQEPFKNKIADDLYNRLAAIDAADDLKDTVSRWINNIDFDDDKIDKNKFIDNLITRIKPLVDKPDEMKSEIEDLLEELPIVNNNKVIKKLADNLASDVFHVAGRKLEIDKKNSIVSEDKYFESLIMEWLEDIPEILGVIKNHNVISDLVKKLSKIKQKGIGDKTTQGKMKKEVGDWIDAILNSYGKNMDTQTKLTLINKLVDEVVNAAKIDKDKIDELDKQISNWLENEPELIGINQNKIMVQSLAKKLNNAKKQPLNVNKLSEQMEKDVINWIDSAVQNEETKLDTKTKIKLSNKLLDELLSAAADEEDESIIEKQVLDWLEGILELSDIKNNEKIINNLTKKLTNAKVHQLYDDNLLNKEIKDWIDLALKRNGKKLDTDTKNKLSRKLLDMMKNAGDQQSDLENKIWDWLEKFSEIRKANDTGHKKLIQHFANRIQKHVFDNLSDESFEEEITNFVESLSKTGVFINPESINQLAIKLKSKQNETDDDYEDQIWDWLADAVNIFEIDKKTSPIFISKFAKTLKKLVSQKADGDIVEEEINNFIKLLLKENVHLTATEKGQMAKSLIQKLSPLPNQEDFRESIKNKISDLIENIPNVSESKRKDKLVDILTRNVNHLTEKNDNIKRELTNILRKEAKLSENNAEKLASTLIDRISQQLCSDQLYPSVIGDLNTSESEIRKQVSEEVSHILNDFNIKGKKRKEIEQDIAEVMKDQIFRGIDDDESKKNIFSILQGVDLSKDDANDISNRLLDKKKELSLSYRINGSKQMISMKKDAFERRAEQEISEFIDDLSIDYSPQGKNKINKVTEELVHRLGEIMSDPAETEKEKRTIEEVYNYLKKLSFDTDEKPREEMAKKLANRLIDIEFQTSTPKKDLSFYPQRDFLEISSINFDDTQSIQQFTKPMQTNNNEKIYTNELIDIIKLWINDLPIDLSKEKKCFEKNMIRDLAEDIVDRQKYLQLNPDANTSDQEELDHFKFQVFKWLNKLKIDNFSPIMQKTGSLMRTIKDVKIPELFKPMNLDPIKNEISIWFDEVSSSFNGSTDQYNKNMLIEQLYEKIQQLKSTNQMNKLDGEITNWLKIILKDADNQDIAKMTESLISRLKQKVLTEPSSFVLSQDSNQFVEENLIGGIEDWLKTLPIYHHRNSAEKREVATLIPDLAKAIKLILISAQPHEDTDKLCIEKIVEHLQKMPLDMSHKSDSEILQKTAMQLLYYLKGLQMFQNMSERQERPSDEYLKANLDDWMNSLPMINFNSSETVQFEDLKKKFVEKVKQIRQEHPRNDTKLKDEIRKYLLAIPIEENMKHDQKFMNDKVEQLMKNLLAVPVETKRRHSFDRCIKKAADGLINNIESWCDNLPIKGSPEEIEKAKKEISTKLIHKIGELNMNPEVFNDDFLYDELLEDEIDNLLSDISSQDSKINLPVFKKDLMENVKMSRLKTLEENAGQAYKKQLRDAISKTLPSLDMSDAEQASFEVLQDKLVDAFINLHYVGENNELKNKYKTKIKDEIEKFCNEYLRKHPKMPIASQKLNQDLYSALKSVPVPKEETIRNEVELAKTKDELHDWVKELPPKDQTPAEKIQMTKMVNVLAKKLHDIEKQKLLSPDEDYDDYMKKEITRWLRKLPLSIDEATIAGVTNKLMDKLKSTEKSRRVSASARHSIDPDIFSVSESRPTRQSVSKPPEIPPSSLSIEDREHLQRIRDRNSGTFRHYNSKDASVSPLPIDAGSQTEVRPLERCKRLDLQSSGIQTQIPPYQKTMQAVGSQSEVSPHVIVKEYYWDTPEANASKKGCFSTSPESAPKSQMSSPCPGRSRNIPRQPSRITLSPRAPCPQATAQRPCFRPEEEPETSRSFRRGSPKVTRLGSFDDMQPNASKSGNWSKFPEDDFWGDRRTLISDDDEEPYLQERNRDEEKVRCRCRERVFTKCSAQNKNKGCHTSQSKEDVKRCSKCCGIHCPYPSYLYFRQ